MWASRFPELFANAVEPQWGRCMQVGEEVVGARQRGTESVSEGKAAGRQICVYDFVNI